MNTTVQPITNLVGEGLPPIEGPAVSVSRMSIWSLVLMFLGAVGLHALIGYYLKKTKEEIVTKGSSAELTDKLKILNLLFRWYPAGAVVVLIFVLYF